MHSLGCARHCGAFIRSPPRSVAALRQKTIIHTAKELIHTDVAPSTFLLRWCVDDDVRRQQSGGCTGHAAIPRIVP